MELNTTHVGDCLSLMSSLPNDYIDLTVTSPPYDNLRSYNGYSFDFENIARELFRITKVGGVVVWVVNDATIEGSETLTSFKQALFFKEVGFNVHDTMIYAKKGLGARGSKYAYTQSFEYIFIFSKGRPKTFNPLMRKNTTKAAPYRTTRGSDREKSGGLKGRIAQRKEESKLENVWFYAVGGTSSDKKAIKHPAVFPEKLAEDHILSWSNELDIVLDPMCGSGTTLKMAKLNKRNYIGFDISEEYIEICEERLGLI